MLAPGFSTLVAVPVVDRMLCWLQTRDVGPARKQLGLARLNLSTSRTCFLNLFPKLSDLQLECFSCGMIRCLGCALSLFLSTAAPCVCDSLSLRFFSRMLIHLTTRTQCCCSDQQKLLRENVSCDMMANKYDMFPTFTCESYSSQDVCDLLRCVHELHGTNWDLIIWFE